MSDAWDTVTAEDAPIGVQLWPTIDPKYAPNYTLARVETVRGAYRSWVRWVYESGTVREFDLGTRVTVKLA